MPLDVRDVVLQGDCLEVMAGLPDSCVDMVLTDLPYGQSVHTQCSWDRSVDLAALWAHYRRLLKPRGAVVLTAVQPFTTALINSNPAWFKYAWVWQKSMATDFLNARNKPLRAHEDILVFAPGTCANRSARRMTYNPQGLVYRPEVVGPGDTATKMKAGSVVGPSPSHVTHYTREWTNYPTSIIAVPNPNGRLLHPTEKPVALFAYLIRTYTNPGDVVLDNCAGSGTTAVACIQEGRHYILIEKEPQYVDLCRQRIAAAQPSLPLSAACG